MAEVVTLMTTEGCHLCEQAQSMWQYLQQAQPEILAGYRLQPCEITSDELLVQRYGIRIPVLVRGKQELGWPFEPEQILAWLQSGITEA